MRMLGRILVCLVFLLIALGVVGGAFWQRYASPGPSSKSAIFLVPKGAGLEEVSVRLAEAGLIADAKIFAIGASVEGLSRRFKFGEFEFPAHVSPRAAAEIIASGKTIQRRLTIPEGLTVKQVMTLLNRAEGFEGEVALPPEGTLLPDTWFYSWGDNREKFIERQRQAMRRVVQELWPQRIAGLPLKTVQEALVLASIVEKETAIAAERPRVAAVFINRLKRNMRLQADPTVVYGLNEGAGPLERAISRADLETPHAWNTYVIDGLPPTPIANPGRASIEAVLKPLQNDELYFVADGTGGHVFARTLADHARNVERLRALERQRPPRAN